MKSYLKVIFEKKSEYSLEYMLVIIASFIGITTSFVTAIFNYILGLNKITIISSILLGLFSLIAYCLTKYFNKLYSPILIVIIVLSCIFYPTMWVYNGGSFGGISYFMLFNAAITAIFFNNSNYKPILILQIAIIAELFYFEYLHPEYITGYENNISAYIDKTFSFILVFVLLFFTIKKVMAAYNQKFKN